MNLSHHPREQNEPLYVEVAGKRYLRKLANEERFRHHLVAEVPYDEEDMMAGMLYGYRALCGLIMAADEWRDYCHDSLRCISCLVEAYRLDGKKV